jgi:hypothetical protein
MIRELETLAPAFDGFASHTRCFLHIVNLVAKSLLRQFDAKKVTVENDAELTEWVNDLTEEENAARIRGEDDDNATGDKDNDDGWVDEMNELSENEKLELERSIRPVKLALVKVS